MIQTVMSVVRPRAARRKSTEGLEVIVTRGDDDDAAASDGNRGEGGKKWRPRKDQERGAQKGAAPFRFVGHKTDRRVVKEKGGSEGREGRHDDEGWVGQAQW